MKKLLNKQNKVKALLIRSKEMRDNDSMLIAKIWAEESGFSENNPFLKMLLAGKLTSADSITRARRKVQENNPNLRGKMYNKRQQRAATIKKQIAK